MANSAEPTPPELPFPVTEFFLFLIFLVSIATVAGTILFSSHVALSLLVFLLFCALPITLLPLKALSGQNIFAIAVVIMITSAAAEAINSQTHLPFGQRNGSDDFGPQLFHSIPIFMPFIWIIAVINSRGASRFLLRVWIGMPNWGLFVIALGSLLSGLFFAGFSHFSSTMHFCAKSDSPWLNFVGHIAVTALILIIAAPWLINKKPGRTRSPEIYPLLVWLLALALFAMAQRHP